MMIFIITYTALTMKHFAVNMSIRGTRKLSYSYYAGCLVKSVTSFGDGVFTEKSIGYEDNNYILRCLFSVRSQMSVNSILNDNIISMQIAGV